MIGADARRGRSSWPAPTAAREVVHRHGPPRPPQRARPHRRPPLRDDPRRVRGRGDPRRRHRDARGRHRRREVPPRRARAPTGLRERQGRSRSRCRRTRATSSIVDPVVEGRARADQTSRKGRELTHDPNVGAAGPDPRRRRLPRPGRRGRDAQPAGARRLHHRRHGPHHHRTTSSASRPTPTTRARRATRRTSPRASTSRSSTSTPTTWRPASPPSGSRWPSASEFGRDVADRPDRLPPLRPQRDRRARLHAAADVREDQDAPAACARSTPSG